MSEGYSFWKYFACSIIGSSVGWIVEEFKPSFPLAIVAVIFIVYDAITARKLDGRVRNAYPDRVRKKESRFSSYLFGKVVRQTIPERLMLIFLAFIVEHWVFIHVTIPFSYCIAGVICIEQFVSILENESSCRNDRGGRIYRMLQRILVDKTERHFDVSLDELKKECEVSNEGTDN